MELNTYKVAKVENKSIGSLLGIAPHFNFGATF
jgi:hypothetical protein